MKLCTNCKEWKDKTNFYKDKKGKEGLQSQCKNCKDKKNKRWEKENPEKVREIQRMWIAKNREYRNLKVREWYAKNIAKRRESNLIRNNRFRFSGNRHKALKRDDYRCVVCGQENSLVIHHKDGSGYTKLNNKMENLVTLCRGCHVKIHRWQEKNNKLLLSNKDIIKTLINTNIYDSGNKSSKNNF